MKFSVEVETNSSLYDAPCEVPHKKSSLTWDIQVEVEQVRLLAEHQVEKKTEEVVKKAEQQQQIEREAESVSAISSKTSVVSRKESSTTSSMQINVGNKRTETSSASEMAEARKLSRLMNARGRKVSRQGDWLVFTEKVGVLTSQNGVQQVRETRVRINSEDLVRLLEMGF